MRLIASRQVAFNPQAPSGAAQPPVGQGQGGSSGGQSAAQLPPNVAHPGDTIVPGGFVPNNPYYVGLTVDGGRVRPINPGEQPLVWFHSYADGTGNGQYEGNMSQWFRMGGGTLTSGGVPAADWNAISQQSRTYTPPPPQPSANQWGGAAQQVQQMTAQSANAPLLQNQTNQLNDYLTSAETNVALAAARDAYMQNLQRQNANYAQTLNAQGAWANALATQAAMGYRVTPGWLNYMYGPQNPYATAPSTGGGTGFYLQPPTPLGISVDNGYSEEPSFTPGLTGAINNQPMYASYNGGNYSTQVSGLLLSPPGGQNYQSPQYAQAPMTSLLPPGYYSGWTGDYVQMVPGQNGYGGYAYPGGGSGPMQPVGYEPLDLSLMPGAVPQYENTAVPRSTLPGATVGL